MAEKRTNVRLVINPDDDLMFDLIRKAHINLMVTFQPTGLKLKLLNALYNGRFCLVNGNMLHGTQLSTLCTKQRLLKSSETISMICSTRNLQEILHTTGKRCSLHSIPTKKTAGC